jgi:phosphatidylserine decarboxylase
MRNSLADPSYRLAPGAGKELTLVGIPFALSLMAAVLLPGVLTIGLATVLAALLALLLYFFRDPRRTPPGGEKLFLAPADGRVMEVTRVEEPRFVNGEALKISTFMSLFDVHVNRAPVRGEIVLVQHVPGQFLQAFRPEASEANEHNLIGLDTRHGRVLVKQVAGILARRIVCWVRPGQGLEAGDRLGVIKFGSRVDLYMPLRAEPVVRVGNRVRAGVTVVARWKGE